MFPRELRYTLLEPFYTPQSSEMSLRGFAISRESVQTLLRLEE